jgi:hypothetical protein
MYLPLIIKSLVLKYILPGVHPPRLFIPVGVRERFSVLSGHFQELVGFVILA